MSNTAPFVNLRVSQFLLPKEGAGAEECEDAVGVNLEARRFAVADGATEAFDAGSWARALAGGWVGGEGERLTVEGFGAWAAGEGERLRESWAGRKLTWYAEEKARAGSFAAFVGVGFGAEGGRLLWRSIALGDACLVQRRGRRVLAATPLAGAGEFNSSPALVPSHAAALGGALARAVVAGGEAEPGDTFLLMSDAAAAWFFRLSESGAVLLEEFDSLLAASDNEALAALLRSERAAGRIRDDDVAIIRIAVEEE